MKKCISIILTVLFILSFAACGSENGDPESISVLSSEEKSVDMPQKLSIVSKNKFLSELSDLGEVNDSSDENGFEACFIKAETVNYIYMFLPTEDMAEEILNDDDQGKENSTVICSGENYEYSESRSVSGKDNSLQYNVNLRVDNMLIVVSGSSDNRKEIMSDASAALKKLGYSFT